MKRESRWPSAAVLLVGVCVLLVIHAFFYNATLDDSFITFRYSNNLLAGDGPRWNPGELPVEGYTSFTWMVLMALPGLVPEHQAFLANVVGTAAGLAGLVIAWKLARRFIDNDRLAVFAPLLLALDRTYAGWCTGGLETSLFTTLVLYGYWRWLEESTEGSARTPIAGVVFALATLTRPEGAMFYGLAMLWSLVLWKQGRMSKRAFVFHVVAFLVLVGGHLAWRLSYYGVPLPNTFYTKVNGLYWTSGLAYLLLFVRDHAMAPLVFFAGIAGWIYTARRPPMRDAAPIALAYLVGLVAYILYIGGDIYEFRFMDVAQPFTAIGATVLVARLHERAVERGSAVWAIVPALAMIVATGATTPYYKLERIGDEEPSLVFATKTPIEMNVERLEAQDHPQPEHEQIGKWLLQHKRPGEVLAIDSAGVIPYFSKISTVDLYGLNDAVIGRSEVGQRGWPGHEKRPTGRYIRERAPTYLVPSIGDAMDAGSCMPLELGRVGAGKICVQIHDELFLTFGTFKPVDEFVAELRARGVTVVEYEDPPPPREAHEP